MSINLAVPKPLNACYGKSPFKFAVGDHVVRVSNTYKSSFKIGMRGYISECPTVNKAGMTGYKVVYPLISRGCNASDLMMISSVAPEEDLEKDVSGSLYSSWDDRLVVGRSNCEALDFWEYYSNDINMTTDFCEKMFKGVKKMNYEFAVSTWVRFLHDFKVDDDHFVPANTIGVIAARSCQCSPTEIGLVYTVNIPSSSWSTVKLVPEKILSEYDREAAGKKIEDIRAYNIWNKNKTEKEISDMDERMMRLFGLFEVNRVVPRSCPTPMRICYDGLTTVVFWEDGTVTSVRCSEEDKDKFSEYSGFTAALAKKMYGTHSDIVRLIEKKRAKPGRPVTPPEKWKKMQAGKKES